MTDFLTSRRFAQFMAIYACQNLHRAAEQVGITQPALTASLRKLEAEIGSRLFERTPTGLVATEAAHVLHRYGVGLREGGRSAREEILGIEEGVTGRLRIGAGVAWTTTLLPPVLRDLRSRYPGLSIDLIADVGDRLARKLLDGEVDVVVAGGALAPLAEPDFACTFLAVHPMVAVADPDAALAKKRAVSPEDLSEADWVCFYEDESILRSITEWLALHGLPPPRFTMRTNSPTALTAYVRETDFVAALIAPLARKAVSDGLVELDLATPLWSLPLNIYNRKIALNTPAVAAFHACLRNA
jgi:DNA-binding transcriptional LysR family regulator